MISSPFSTFCTNLVTTGLQIRLLHLLYIPPPCEKRHKKWALSDPFFRLFLHKQTCSVLFPLISDLQTLRAVPSNRYEACAMSAKRFNRMVENDKMTKNEQKSNKKRVCIT